jgi:ACS family tartrate transporter-like MFS transporter
LTVLTALVHTPFELYLARFVLGASEAVFFPGVIVYLSHWFIHEDRAKATSNFMGAIPLSAVLGSPLAGWILGIQWLGWKGWRWLFVVEGLPAILLGVVAFFVLTDWPREAHWLADDERHWLEGSLHQQTAAGAVSVWQALRSRMVVLFSITLIFSYFMAYSFNFWLPTILKRQSGISDMRVGLFGAIPSIAYFVTMQVNGWLSDRSNERRWHTAIPLFIAAAALLAVATQVHSLASLLFLFTLVGVGCSYVSIFWAIPTEVLDRSTAATAVGLVNGVGSLSGFLGPYTFGLLYAHSGSFAPGLQLMCLSAAVAGVLVVLTPKRPMELAASN